LATIVRIISCRHEQPEFNRRHRIMPVSLVTELLSFWYSRSA
jgi:hypothetical protein